MSPGRASRGRSTVAALLFTATAASGVVPPPPTELSHKAVRHPRLLVPTVRVPAVDLARSVHAASLLGSPPSASYVDGRSGRFATLLPSTPLVPGDGVGNTLTWADLGRRPASSLADVEDATRQALRRYLAEAGPLLGIDREELGATRAAASSGQLVQLWQGRQVAGVPVRDSFLTAAVSHGNLVLLGTRSWGEIDVATDPSIGPAAAEDVLRRHLEPLRWAGWRARPHLELVPLAVGTDALSVPVGDGLTYRLAWVLAPRFDGELAEWEALVDAHDGELLAFEDRASYASSRSIVGGVLPVSNDGVAPDGVEVPGTPMPFVAANGSLVSDKGGNVLACVDGDLGVAPLAGPYVRIDDDCGPFSETTALDVLDFGTNAGTNCAVPPGGSPGNTRAARSGFHELNRIQEMARSHLPTNTWLREQLTANMNIDNICGATWSGGQVHFYRGGGGCSNAGELAAVFDHEWGHGLDDNDVNGAISSPGEGIADLYAALRLATSCIGRNFLPGPCGGYGDPCTECTGVRDIDYAKHQSGAPHTFTWANETPGCGGAHCRGVVYAEAVWDLWKRDLPTLYGMSDHTAHELVTRLTYLAAGNVGTWFSGVPPEGGCGADGGYLLYLAADDDNGTLLDGTPHMAAIHAAFARHEIACSTPTVQDAGCATTPTLAPTVAGVAIDRGAELSWGPVAGATGYRVFRTDGVFACSFGRTLVSEGADLAFRDTGLTNGRAFSFQVAAMGPGDSCLGPLSDCTTVIPTAAMPNPDLVLRPVAGSAELGSPAGDGDPFVDNCEPLRLDFAVENLTTAPATNLRIVAVSSDAGTVTSLEPLPKVIAGELAASCGATVYGTLFAQVGGLAPGEPLVVTLSLAADGAAPATADITFAVPVSEIDLGPAQTHTFAYEADLSGWSVGSGTFMQSTAGGGADGTAGYLRSSVAQANACDRVVSPLLALAADSTMQLWTSFDIEDHSGGAWYDRANLALVDGGERVVVAPSAGRAYNAVRGGPGSFSGCTAGEAGWAGSQTGWATSSWSAAALGSAGLAGTPIRIEASYATDPVSSGDGFRFDQLAVTNARLQTADAQSDACGPSPLVFADGFETGDDSRWSQSP